MKTVFAKILSLLLVFCLVGTTYPRGTQVHSCKEQSHSSVQHTSNKECQDQEEMPSCCTQKHGGCHSQSTCCVAIPVASYAKLEKLTTYSTFQVSQKGALTTSVSPFVSPSSETISQKEVLLLNYLPLLLLRDIPILFQHFLC